MRKICIFFCGLFFLPSCDNNLSYEGPILNVLFENNAVLLADSIFENVEYIPLETVNRNLLSEIDKVVVINDTIYILDRNQYGIFQFDMTGRFLQSLFRRGIGPGDYLALTDFLVCDSTVAILSAANKKIFLYSKKDFSFIGDLSLPVSAVRFNEYNNCIFLYSGDLSNEGYNIYIIDKKSGNVINKYHKLDITPEKQFFSRKIFNISSQYNYYYQEFGYDIYEAFLEGDSIVFRLDFGEDNMFDSDFINLSSHEKKCFLKNRYADVIKRPISGIDNLYFSDSILFFSFVKGVLPYWYIRVNENIPYIGNIKATVEYPLVTPIVSYIDEEYIYEMVYPETILEKVEYCKENGKEHLIAQIPDWLISGIKFDDNPVLCRYKLKK